MKPLGIVENVFRDLIATENETLISLIFVSFIVAI